MSDKTINDLSGIDKYSGSYDQDELGVTQIPTETIRLLNNFTLLALFTFLASCSSDWKLNAKHLAKHFNCNKDKIYKAIDSLIELNLLTRTQVRDKGKFVRYHYRLHLRQKVQIAPSPEKPDTVKPDTVKPDTYKTNILPLENKEDITTTTETVVVVDINSRTLTETEKTKLSDAFLKNPIQSTYIKNLDNFLSASLHSILNREEHITRRQRVHGIIKLVKQRVFEEPALWAKGQKKEEEKRPETREEYNARIARYMEENKQNTSK